MTGAENHILSLVNHINRETYEPSVICFQPGHLVDELKKLGVPTQVFPVNSKFDVLAIWRLAHLLGRKKPDLIHTHAPRAMLLGNLAAKIAGLPTVTTIHESTTHKLRSPLKTFVYQCIEDLLIRETTMIIAVSHALETNLINERGHDKSSIKVIHNGIDLSKFDADKIDPTQESRLLSSLDLNPHAPIIGTIGRLDKEKGHYYFVEAIPQILRAFPEAKFVVVGDGHRASRLRQYCHGLGIKQSVLFLGWRKDIPELLSVFHVFVLPSIWEAFGITAVEAMAMEKPVVASRCGGVEEIIEDGVTGVLVPPADPDALARAVMSLLQNPEKATTLAMAGRDFVRVNFDAALMARETQKVYERICGSIDRNSEL